MEEYYSYIIKLENYIDKIQGITDTKDMKRIVKKIYHDNEIDDFDFNYIIDEYIAPTLSKLGADMSYDEESNLSSTDKILLERY